MHTKLVVFVVFSLIIFMIAPAYANVTSVSLEKSYYTNEEKMIFIGKEQEGKKTVVVIIRDPVGVFKGMLSDFMSESDGTFSTTPTEKSVTKFFDSKGTYNATAFTNEQKEDHGITIKLQYDGNKVLVVPDFALTLNSILDKTIEEEKTLEFTPTLTESLTGVIFSLEKNPPTWSSINNETGKFTWTPKESQGPASYVFDIVVKKGALEDRESITITVTEPVPVTQPEPEPTPVTEPAKEVKHFVVPQREVAPEPLIGKPLKSLEAGAHEGIQLRIKCIRHHDCVEVGKDHFDEVVTTFLNKIGEASIIKLDTFNYAHRDLETRDWVTDYGVFIFYKN